ncbi:hypothetical protein RB195_018535 [Necator americanus]|uniref:Secreted protein n=1 Tax=Necator americanus TaxID=51031 RepID=A0ABR1CCI9_NECAM
MTSYLILLSCIIKSSMAASDARETRKTTRDRISSSKINPQHICCSHDSECVFIKFSLLSVYFPNLSKRAAFWCSCISDCARSGTLELAIKIKPRFSLAPLISVFRVELALVPFQSLSLAPALVQPLTRLHPASSRFDKSISFVRIIVDGSLRINLL